MSILSNLVRAVTRNKPQLFTAFGIAGWGAATGLAIYGTVKAVNAVEDKKYELDVEYLTPKEIAQTVWKYYVPVAASAAAGTICVLTSNSIHMKRNAALATACQLSEVAFRDYKEEVREEVGEEQERAISKKTSEKRIAENPPPQAQIIEANKLGKTLCYDPIIGRWWPTDVNTIRKAESILNRKIVHEMKVTLNDFYYEVGAQPIMPLGEELVWDIDHGAIAIDVDACLNDSDEPCLAIRYDPMPEYDRTLLAY